jgi:hypothetical protein
VGRCDGVSGRVEVRQSAAAAPYRLLRLQIAPSFEASKEVSMARLIGFVCMLLLAGSCLAQDKYEFGIGYSLAHMPVRVTGGSVNKHALALDFSRYLNHRVAFTGEFDAYYHCVAGCQPYSDFARNNSVVFMVGPRVNLFRTPRWTPWVHGLVGVGNMRFSRDPILSDMYAGDTSQTGLAAAAGGGVDYNLGRVSFRIGPFDYFRTPSSVARNNFRIGFGVGVRFGKLRPR